MTDNLKNKVLKLLRSYRLTMSEDGEGNGYPLVDAVTPPGDAAITRGIEELEYLAEDISRTLEPIEAENKRLREALEADRPKGIAEKFATLVEKKDGWYRGIIDYKLDDGDVTRVGELKVTLVGEQSPSVFFKQEAKGPPFPDPAISANKATVILWEAKGTPLRDPAIEDKGDLTWPSLKTRQKRGCRKRLASGQWWAFCGETDMGQTAPALCTECGGEFKLEPVRQE